MNNSFQDIVKRNPADRSQQRSYFFTTYKYQVYDWFANLIIIPTYFLVISLVVFGLSRVCVRLFQACEIINNDSGKLFGIHILMWVVFLLTLLPTLFSTFLSRPWWRIGFKGRNLLVILSFLILF
jgi:hypothetical protein